MRGLGTFGYRLLTSGSPPYGALMRSVITREFGGPEALDLVELDSRTRSGQLRIRVVASSVNPIDLSTRAGRLTQAGLMAPAAQVGMGWDVAGTVDAVGAGITRFAVVQPSTCRYPGAEGVGQPCAGGAI